MSFYRHRPCMGLALGHRSGQAREREPGDLEHDGGPRSWSGVGLVGGVELRSAGDLGERVGYGGWDLTRPEYEQS